MRPLEVAVIGCGTAGAASALLLARAGHAVTVFEAVEEPGPVGAGIMIQPTGMRVLRRLGLLSHARRAHLAYYQWATRFLTPFFQSHRGWLAWPRDALMGVACKLPYIRTRMIRTMCGLERGVLLPDPLPMPELGRARGEEARDVGVYRTAP